MTHIQHIARAGLVAAALLVVASPAAAQNSSARGFFVGANVGGASIKSDDFSDDTENGGNLGLQLGWGFTKRLSLVADLSAAKLDDGAGGDIGFTHVDLGVRYAWTGARKLVPSVEVALSGRALGQKDVTLEDGTTGDITYSGAGLTLGGGLQYYASPTLALGAQLKLTGGKFDTFKVDDTKIDGFPKIDASSARVVIGVTWYPGAGR